MDDLAHETVPPLKRKADHEDSADTPADSVACPEAILVDSSSLPPCPCGPSNAPRMPWLAEDAGNQVWPSPTSPTSHNPLSGPPPPFEAGSGPSVKRLRLDPTHLNPSRRSQKRHSYTTRRPTRSHSQCRRLRREDVQDIGIVSASPPGPTSGSLLRSPSLRSLQLQQSSAFPLVHIDPKSPHIPSLQPLVNRQTLKELDLDAILRNPQLRHDLLFDTGLQFRPTSSKRKREVAENYWLAVTRELETGCTCVSFDLHGKPHAMVCACEQVALPSTCSILAFSSSLRVLTLRMPSRIRPLLSEFLEVLLSVIQPLSSISGMYVNPSTFEAQMREHSAQAAHMRSVFDPELIQQELRHGVFDPSGLFRSIGQTLKSHCAPMRDRAVEAMVELAQSCAPGGSGSKADAVKAVRMCMDILELMKLDIANHQLETLRPFLIRTSGQFELKTFRTRNSDGSVEITRDWIRTAHRSMIASKRPIPHDLHPSGPLDYRSLHRNQQVYLAVLKALTDLVFIPPSSLPELVSPISPTTPSLNTFTPIPALSHYPETSYLDSARLLVLSTDAADVTALYMFLLLYRQLLFSEGRPQSSKVDQVDLLNLKKEIKAIGTSHLGYCFTRGFSKARTDDISTWEERDVKDLEKWRTATQDITLQIALRAKEAQSRPNLQSVASTSHDRAPIGQAPDDRLLKVAERWSDSNMQPDSPLSIMLRDRLRDVVFSAVVALTFPNRDTVKSHAIDLASSTKDSSMLAPLGKTAGMEPLTDEIRSIAQRLSRLALIHLNTYLPIYEAKGFLD